MKLKCTGSAAIQNAGYHEGWGIEPLFQSATDALQASGLATIHYNFPSGPLQTILFSTHRLPSGLLILELLIEGRQQNWWKSIHAVWPFQRMGGTGGPIFTFLQGSFTPWSLALNQRDWENGCRFCHTLCMMLIEEHRSVGYKKQLRKAPGRNAENICSLNAGAIIFILRGLYVNCLLPFHLCHSVSMVYCWSEMEYFNPDEQSLELKS